MTWSKWFVAPAITSLFFLLGVLTLYWFITNKIIQHLDRQHRQPNAAAIRTNVGLVYMVIILIISQTSVSGTAYSWAFTNFQIFAIVFVSYFLMLEIQLWQLLIAIGLFMGINETMGNGWSWLFASVYVAFYFVMKLVKTHHHHRWTDFLDFTIATLFFSAILWGLMGAQFHLPLTTLAWELVFSFFILSMMYVYVDSLLAGADTLAQLTYTTNYDDLTGVNNYYAFKNDFDQAFKKATGTQSPLTLMLFDIDHFKHVNDTYGHLTGDYVLNHVAQTMMHTLAELDSELVLYRTGGEEFTILFTDYTTEQATGLITTLTESIRQHTFHHGGQDLNVRLSVGVTQRQPDDREAVDLFRRADQNLYYAKQHGRDQVKIN